VYFNIVSKKRALSNQKDKGSYTADIENKLQECYETIS